MLGLKRNKASPYLEQLRAEKERLMPAMQVDLDALREAATAARRAQAAHFERGPVDGASEFDARCIELDGSCNEAQAVLDAAERAHREAACRVTQIVATIDGTACERQSREEIERLDGELVKQHAEYQRATSAIVTITAELDAKVRCLDETAERAAAEALDRRIAGESLEPASGAAEDPELERLDAMLRVARQRQSRAAAAITEIKERAAHVRASWRLARVRCAEIAFKEAQIALGSFAADLAAARQLAGQYGAARLDLEPNAAEVEARVREIEAEIPPARVVTIDVPAQGPASEHGEADENTEAAA